MFTALKRKTVSALAPAILAAAVLGLAHQAAAFCFSNDSLSNTSMSVRQIETGPFLKTLEKAANTACRGMSSGEAKTCAKLKRKLSDGLKAADRDLRKGKHTGAAIDAATNAADEAYQFITGLPVAGDAVNMSARVVNKATGALKDGLVKIGRFIDDVTSNRFKQNIGPDGTKCCNWKNRDCNPSGKKDGEIYFNVKYGNVTRTVRMGATDHMECRIVKGYPQYTACKKYKWPYSPFRAHKHTARGRLIKSLHSGKCLDVWDNNKKNGANVKLSNCHGGKNQRWTIYKNGTIRSELNRKCLDVQGGNKGGKNGQNVIMHTCHGDHNQRWTYGRGDKIISRAAGRYNWCLEIQGGSKSHGANAQIWRCADVGQHRWRVVKK